MCYIFSTWFLDTRISTCSHYFATYNTLQKSFHQVHEPTQAVHEGL